MDKIVKGYSKFVLNLVIIFGSFGWILPALFSSPLFPVGVAYVLALPVVLYYLNKPFIHYCLWRI